MLWISSQIWLCVREQVPQLRHKDFQCCCLSSERRTIGVFWLVLLIVWKGNFLVLVLSWIWRQGWMAWICKFVILIAKRDEWARLSSLKQRIGSRACDSLASSWGRSDWGGKHSLTHWCFWIQWPLAWLQPLKLVVVPWAGTTNGQGHPHAWHSSSAHTDSSSAKHLQKQCYTETQQATQQLQVSTDAWKYRITLGIFKVTL